MVLSDDVRAALDEGLLVADWIEKSLPGLVVKGDHRHRVPAQLFDLALEHHRSILYLLRVPHCSSAFALVRCQFECFVRGVWLNRCATDEQIDDFVTRDEIPTPFGNLIVEIETTPEFSLPILSKAKGEAWGPMNGYTHGGIHQISRRLVDGHVEPNFEDEAILEVMSFTGAFALLALGQIAELAERPDLFDAADALLKSLEAGPLPT